MNNEAITFLFVLGVIVLVAPVLSIIAMVRVGRLERRMKGGGAAGESDTEQRIANLTARLFALETLARQLMAHRPSDEIPKGAPMSPAAVSEQPPAPVPSAAEHPPSMPPLSPPPSVLAHPASVPAAARTARAPARRELDYESLIAGRWLNYAGILAVLFAVAFFLKYAFDNDWVGPNGRVGIGLIFGALLLAGSDILLKRGYRYFSEGIAGLGAAILYLSLWGGWHYYKLFEQNTAFIAMIVVTAAIIVVAIGRNSQRIAVMALAGGFLTPLLLSTGHDAEVTLFSYCFVLVAGLLALEHFRGWVWLPPLAFVSTQIYYWGWYGQFYREDKLAITAFFATIFFAAFSALPIVRSRSQGSISTVETIIVPANALIYLLALYEMLWPGHRWTITFATLALAAGYLIVLRSLPPEKKGQPSLTRLLFAGIALTYATLAIPLRLDQEWLTIALAIEGALLVWTGFRISLWYLRAAGFILFAVSAFRLTLLDMRTTTLIMNGRFGTYAAVVACYIAACMFAIEAKNEVGDNEKLWFGVLAVAANVCALVAFSLEVWDYFGRTRAFSLERTFAQSLGLSLLWTIYAVILIAIGFARKSSLLRWQALALFGLVVVKVFLFDLSFLERFYRILSFLVLGLLLLAVSFYYQRKIAARSQEQRP